jgi:hypothetical protein
MIGGYLQSELEACNIFRLWPGQGFLQRPRTTPLHWPAIGRCGLYLAERAGTFSRGLRKWLYIYISSFTLFLDHLLYILFISSFAFFLYHFSRSFYIICHVLFISSVRFFLYIFHVLIYLQYCRSCNVCSISCPATSRLPFTLNPPGHNLLIFCGKKTSAIAFKYHTHIRLKKCRP